MVNVTVGVDDSLDRLLALMLVVEIQANLGSFCRHQRIDESDTLLALYDGHVGEI
ncbi:hypothetical protein D3C76_1624190 [compost metagenome]